MRGTISIGVFLLASLSAPRATLALDIRHVLAAFDVRCQALRAGYFEYEETSVQARRPMPSEEKLKKLVEARIRALKKKDKTAGRTRPEAAYVSAAKRDLNFATQVARQQRDTPVKRYQKKVLVEFPYVCVETLEIVGDAERKRRTKAYKTYLKREVNPWQSDEAVNASLADVRRHPIIEVYEDSFWVHATPTPAPWGYRALVIELPKRWTIWRFNIRHPAEWEQPHVVARMREVDVKVASVSDARHGACVRLDTFKKGRLTSQWWLKPDFGYALVKMVSYNPNEQIRSVYSYDDFKQVGNGIWWAMKQHRIVPGRRVSRVFTKVDLTRRPSEPRRVLPVGAMVVDTRVKPQIRYRTSEMRPWVLSLSEAQEIASKKRKKGIDVQPNAGDQR